MTWLGAKYLGVKCLGVKCLGMKCLLLLPVPLALAACEVGHVKMPMAPMTLGPSEAPRASCPEANETAPGTDCRTQAPLQQGR